MKTVDFLDALKARTGSDYATAKALRIPRGTVSSWRTGRSHFDDHMARRVADLLGEDEAYVVACAHAERAKASAERAMWERVAAAFARAALVVVAVGLGTPPLPAEAAPDTVYYVQCWRHRWLRRFALTLFGPLLSLPI